MALLTRQGRPAGGEFWRVDRPAGQTTAVVEMFRLDEAGRGYLPTRTATVEELEQEA